MIHALPGSRKDELLQYTKLTESLRRYLKSEWLKDTDTALNKSPVDFIGRLVSLEDNTLMAYIRIGKRQSEQLSAHAASRFKENVSTVLKALDLERCDQGIALDQWDSLAKKALEENTELLYTFASQRREQSAEFLKTLERSTEVLSVVIELCAQRQCSDQSNDSNQDDARKD